MGDIEQARKDAEEAEKANAARVAAEQKETAAMEKAAEDKAAKDIAAAGGEALPEKHNTAYQAKKADQWHRDVREEARKDIKSMEAVAETVAAKAQKAMCAVLPKVPKETDRLNLAGVVNQAVNCSDVKATL